MSTSVATSSYSKTQLPSKQSKIVSKNAADEDTQNSNKGNKQGVNDSKKKSQIASNSSPKNGGKKDDQKLQLNSNLQQSQLEQNQQGNKSPYKMSSVTHNNGYYSLKSYQNQRNQEIEENIINKNLQISEAIDKSQKDIRLKLSQQVHMADIFLSQPHSQQTLTDWKIEQQRETPQLYQQNEIENNQQDYIPQTPQAFNDELKNYYGDNQNEFDSFNSSRHINLKPSDTKLSDYLNLRNQVQSPSIHQRLYHQAVIQQKKQQQAQQQYDKSQNNNHSIFSVGPRNYSSEKNSFKYRSSSNRKQRPTFQSGSKMPPDDDMSYLNETPQNNQNNFSTKYFSQSQDFGGEGDDSYMFNNQTPTPYQKQRNISSNQNYRSQSNGRYQNRQDYKKLNLPQIDQNIGNSVNGGIYPHSTTVRSSLKQPFSRQQSPTGQNSGFNTPMSKTPRLSYKRRDSATRVKDLANSIQERYSDKIQKMKLKYSKNNNPFSQNQNQDDGLDSYRYQQSQQQDGQPYGIQKKEFQQSIQQAAINIEEQRQRIKLHEEERDQELIDQNNTYRGNNRNSLDNSPQYSSMDRKNEINYNYNQQNKNRDNSSQLDKFNKQLGIFDDSGNKGNYIIKDQIRKLSSYNLKLNNAEEKIQRILTQEEQKQPENQQLLEKQVSQNNKINGKIRANDISQPKEQTRRNSQQNLAILGNRNQKFIEFDNQNELAQVRQRDQLRNHKDILDMQNHQNSNSNSPRNRNVSNIPRSDSKTKRIQQNYYYEQEPQLLQNSEYHDYTNPNSQPHTPYSYDDDFSRIQTRNEKDITNDEKNNDRYYNVDNNQQSNLDEIYQRKRENIVKRVQEDIHTLTDKMETFDNVGDLKMKKISKEIKPQRKNQANEIIPNQIQEYKNYTQKGGKSITQRDGSSDQRNPHRTQNPTLIDTFEGEKNNKYNYSSLINKQNSIGKDSRFDTFDSKIKGQQPSSSIEYQQRMTFLDKQLADLQDLKDKQKQKYIRDSENNKLQNKYLIPDRIDEDERYRTTHEHFNSQNDEYQMNQSRFNTPLDNNLGNYEEDDILLSNPKGSPRNHEIKNYNMVKKPPVKAINKNLNELEKIQNNLGNIEKQLDQINQKYNKYQPNSQQKNQDMEDRLFTFQVDERIYKKFKKYLPSDVNQRANQIQMYEQFSAQLQDKVQYDEQQQLEDYLDAQIKTQLQKFLPLDVSQRLQIERQEPINSTDTSQLLEKEPQFEEFINRKIQERLMAYLPNDITTRLNELPKENQNLKRSNQNIN